MGRLLFLGQKPRSGGAGGPEGPSTSLSSVPAARRLPPGFLVLVPCSGAGCAIIGRKLNGVRCGEGYSDRFFR